jgi:hypothetical protein
MGDRKREHGLYHPMAAQAIVEQRKPAIRVKKNRSNQESRARFDGIEAESALAPLIRHGAMLSTTANPTDGLRFDGDAFASPKDLFIP